MTERAVATQGDHPVVYCDVDGRWCEILHEKGKFLSLRPLTAAIKLIDAMDLLRKLHDA